MEEMLPWGALWNVDWKLERESESNINFIFILSYFI